MQFHFLQLGAFIVAAFEVAVVLASAWGLLSVFKGLNTKSILEAYKLAQEAQTQNISSQGERVKSLERQVGLLISDKELMQLQLDANKREREGLRQAFHILMPIIDHLPEEQRHLIEVTLQETDHDVQKMESVILDFRVNRVFLNGLRDDIARN